MTGLIFVPSKYYIGSYCTVLFKWGVIARIINLHSKMQLFDVKGSQIF